MNREELLTAAHEAGFVVNFKESRIGIQSGFLVKDCTCEVELLSKNLAAAACLAVRDAVLNERDECASIAKTGFRLALDGDRIGDLIRDRSN